ncbi:tail assembly chaperone [Enterobacter sp. 638]|uniref:Phage tail assembly chaperone gp38 n=1 Tax=Enterobacter sp. (strain 638) TaxID=399742 RepID=A0A9J9KZB2_ENT38|nr:tail assembly chaperone [Enterobacter sp. 638]ABP59505.1 phage tail assembly chaperone gp38 [Enterobacter sp. 638]
MEKYIWSPSLAGFYPTEEQSIFEGLGGWPTDGVEVSASAHDALFPIPEGKCIGTVDGYPAWIDLPPPTHEEMVAQAEIEKQSRIDAANAYINSKQWPGKAAMGRLKDTEKAQYNLWLDYLDELEAVDTSTAPDITWPEPPAA